MNLQDSLKKHEDERPIRKNNRWFYDNKIVACIRGFSLEDDPFSKGKRWEVEVIYVDLAGKAQSARWTFKSEGGEGKWDHTFADALDEGDQINHSWRLGGQIIITKDGREIVSYNLQKVEQDVSLCPCQAKKKLPWVTQIEEPSDAEAEMEEGKEAAATQAVADVAEVSNILEEMEFEPLAPTPEQLHDIATMAAALRVKVNSPTTASEAENTLLLLRKKHIQSAVK